MKHSTAALLLLFSLSACRDRITVARGLVDTSIDPHLCSGLLSYADHQKVFQRMLYLVEVAVRTDSAELLQPIADEIKTLADELKKGLKVEWSEPRYTGRYRWTAKNFFQKYEKGQNFKIDVLSMAGLEVLNAPIQIQSQGEDLLFEWVKEMSVIEYCVFSSTVQALVKFHPKKQPHYVRLITEAPW